MPTRKKGIKVTKTESTVIKPVPAKEKYTIEDILKCDEDSGWKLSDIDNYYFDLWQNSWQRL